MDGIDTLKREALLKRNATILAARRQALFVAWYYIGRKHESLKNQTPAMASKLTDRVWTIKELIERAGAA